MSLRGVSSSEGRVLLPVYQNEDAKCWLSPQCFQSLNLKIGQPVLITPHNEEKVCLKYKSNITQTLHNF